MKRAGTSRAARSSGSVSPILAWATVTGLVVWGGVVLWRYGLLARLTTEDPSRLSWVILLIYVATQCYAGWLAWQLHRDGRVIETCLAPDGERDDAHETSDDPLVLQLLGLPPDSRETDAGDEPNDRLRTLLTDRLSSGWFIADLMFKLGLIGTVIGFIVMLGAITDLRSMDITQAQRMLGDMSAGMRLALYTTLTGLSCGALVGLQFHLLDRSAERLARRGTHLLAIRARPRATDS